MTQSITSETTANSSTEKEDWQLFIKALRAFPVIAQSLDAIKAEIISVRAYPGAKIPGEIHVYNPFFFQDWCKVNGYELIYKNWSDRYYKWEASVVLHDCLKVFTLITDEQKEKLENEAL